MLSEFDSITIVIIGVFVGVAAMTFINLYLWVFNYVYKIDFVQWLKNKRKERVK